MGPCPSRVIVQAPARLHLGFIDLNGECGRVFGSIGVALERPRYVVEAWLSRETSEESEETGDIQRVLHALAALIAPPHGVAVRVHDRIPRHQGFGSGTQRDLALGAAVTRLAGHPASTRELGRLLGRGRRSGVGIAAFDRGGLIVDAGRRHARGDGGRSASAGDLPPVVFQGPVPRDWLFVVAIPPGIEGLSGSPEDLAFRELAPMSESTAGRISRLVLVSLLPGILTDDIDTFGTAVTEIQRLVGEHFAPVQGGPYATERGEAIAEFALKHGAAGAGQSSWGPAVFALVRGETQARTLVAQIEAWNGGRDATVFHTGANNDGAVVRAKP